MSASRLSRRLGLTVSVTCAMLVLAMATLAYTTLSHQLDLLAQAALREKLGQVEHSLIEGAGSIAEVTRNPHGLHDQIIGHDNYTLTLLDPHVPGRVLLSLASHGTRDLPVVAEQAGEFMQFIGEDGIERLAAHQRVRLRNGEQVRVMLSLARSNDATLLAAYVKSTLAAIPMILLLVGGGAWWVLHRELKPLRALRKVAARVSASDLSHRVKVDGLPVELRELADAFNVMLHRLDTDVQHLAQFSDDLAHELRSPMNNLLGKAQVTLSRERTPQQYRLALESCTEELDRLSKMVAQMLFLASASQPALSRTLESVALEDEVQRVTELFSLSAEDKGIALTTHGAGSVEGDRIMIQRAISNLLSNAIRHAPEGGTVAIDIAQAEGAVSLRVSNAGEGIAAAHLPWVFDRFYRVHASRSRHQGGTGLGLAIVRSIMRLHGGEVSAQSDPGGMTTFTLWFALPELQYDTK